MAIRVVDCIGSHYLMGVQQGRLLKPHILKFWETFQNSPQLDLIRKSKLAPKALYLLHCQQKADTFLKKVIKDSVSEQAERLQGIATGADMPEKIIYLLQALEMEFLAKQDSYALGSGFIAAIPPELTATEELILIQNIDYSLPIDEHFFIRRCNPLAGFQSIEVAQSYMAGCFSGINEHGLVILHNNAYPNDNLSVKSIPIQLLIQEALETCQTTDEAIEVITKRHRDSGANILIADPHGKVCILETSRTKWAVRYGNNTPILATNHYHTSEMRDNQFPLDAKWGNKALEGLRNEEVYKSSLERYKRAEEILTSNNPITYGVITDLLADHGISNQPNDNTLCRHGNVFQTKASVIYYPERRSIEILIGNTCNGEYEEFSIKTAFNKIL